jgi:hypothetical protein
MATAAALAIRCRLTEIISRFRASRPAPMINERNTSRAAARPMSFGHDAQLCDVGDRLTLDASSTRLTRRLVF